MRNKYKTVILGIIENQNDEILMTQRIDPKIPEAHLKWDIVGGTKKPNESIKKTLIRECLEETGYKIKIKELLPKKIQKEWKHIDYSLIVNLQCFYCIVYRRINNNTSDKKIKRFEWRSKKEIYKLDLLPTTKEFLKYFLENF